MKAFLPTVAFFFFPGLSFLEAQGILIGWDLPENSTTNSVVSITNSAGLVGLQSINLGAGLGASSRPGGGEGLGAQTGTNSSIIRATNIFNFKLRQKPEKKSSFRVFPDFPYKHPRADRVIGISSSAPRTLQKLLLLPPEITVPSLFLTPLTVSAIMMLAHSSATQSAATS